MGASEVSVFDQSLRKFLGSWLETHLHGSAAADTAQRTILKGDAENPATQLDQQLHRALVDFIRGNSKYPIVSEEDEASHALLEGKDPFWLIDPIDGSREFAQRIPECVSSVALIQPGEAAPSYGMLQDLYGRAAYSSLDFPMKTGKSNAARPVLLWSRGEEKLGLAPYLEQVRSHISSIKPHGSIAFKLLKCALAPMGSAVISLQPKSSWDLAGAAAILARIPELRFTDLMGNPIRFETRKKAQGVICCHEKFFPGIFEALSCTGAQQIRDMRSWRRLQNKV